MVASFTQDDLLGPTHAPLVAAGWRDAGAH